MEFRGDQMKIAQVSATFPPYMAGTGNVCFHQSVELAKLGHDVTVFTSRYPAGDYKYPEIIEVRRFRPLFRIGNAPFIPQLFNIKDYDIVHLHYPFFFGGEIICLLKKLQSTKYVITYHNDVLLEGQIKIFLDRYHKMVMNTVLKNAEIIFTLSMDYARHSIMKDILKEKKPLVMEMPNGVDLEKFNPNVGYAEIKTRHGIGGEDIILFVGALDHAHYFKGLEYLLKSFAKLKDSNSYLVIVGDGELKEYYISLAKKLDIFNKTIFAGKVSNEDLPKYYAASDLVVLPSTGIENFPLVLLEAMAAGKPVITSNIPGVRVVVNEGIDGFLTKPKDVEGLASKVQYLLENKDIRKKFGREGRKKVEEKYSWEKIAKNLEKIYKEIIE